MKLLSSCRTLKMKMAFIAKVISLKAAFGPLWLPLNPSNFNLLMMAFCEVHNSIPEQGQCSPSIYHNLLLPSINVGPSSTSETSYKTAELSFKIMEELVTTWIWDYRRKKQSIVGTLIMCIQIAAIHTLKDTTTTAILP